jgi:hypothetical protein
MAILINCIIHGASPMLTGFMGASASTTWEASDVTGYAHVNVA